MRVSCQSGGFVCRRCLQLFLWCRSVCVAEQVTGVFSVFKRLLESVSRKREVAVKRIRALEKTLAEKGTENERVRAAHEEREREFQRERERLEKDLEERNALIAILEGDLQAAVHGGVAVEQITDEK